MPDSETLQNIFFPARESIEKPARKAKNDESLIVERICAGERPAFEEFYKKLSPMVHGIVLARVPRDEVDDIVQEVFITAFEKLHTLRDRKSLSPWLASVARNRAYEFYRRRKETVELPENLSAGGAAKNKANEILEAIRSLPETYSETLILRLVEGMTGPEIAELTGLKHESVRVNLHRGMKLLKKKLGVEK